jgi:CubicO group peptidase (beta-lactamase class C family)
MGVKRSQEVPLLNIFKLERQIEEAMQAARVPGLALAIVSDLEVIYARGFGVTSIEDGGAPVTPQTLFRVGSITKPHTGTAIMRLVESGKLDLDTPVKEYVPWFELSDRGATDRVTLRRLLSHTAGLPTDYMLFGRRDPGALEASLREELPGYPLLAPPGVVWSYCNPGIRLAGHIAELAAGAPFAQLMNELVFDPLEMRRTTFDTTVAMTYPLAQPHELDENGMLRVQHRFADNAARYPAGLIMSTVLDLANFAVMHMNVGCFRDRKVLSPESVAEMHTPQADFRTVTGAGYGLTFFTDIQSCG